MKTIKEYLNEGLIKRHAGVDMRAKIEAWLDGHKIKNYNINDDFTIDVHLTVWLPAIDEIPLYIQFGKVYGDFNMTHCGVKILRGCPHYCQTFNCRFCDGITNLIGAPERVSYGFNCGYCKNLVSLEGVPDTINGDFDYSFCLKLTDLSYHPKKVSGKLYCYGMNLSKDQILSICKVHRAKIKNKITTA